METFLNFFKLFSYSGVFIEVIDILIVTVLFYTIYNYIRGTLALKVLIGFLIVVVLSLVVKNLQLKTVDFLFKNFWQIALIVLVVVFQPELRRALAKLGENKFFTFILGDFGDIHFKNYEMIARAINLLSKRSIGALVVIEREISLKHIIETGIKLNADITSEFITNLFMSKGPLHDGAMIISKGKIIAAGCILPLSVRTDLPKQFGTRHRAGIGLSEETDAIIIVSSEETGKITFCFKGEFMYDISNEQLLEFLSTYL